MKKSLFFSLTAAMATIGAAYATRKLVDKNGGVKPAFGKARNGVTTMVDKAKSSPAASAITGTLAAWRDRWPIGNNDNPTGDGLTGDIRASQVIAPTAAESSLMQTDEPKDESQAA